MTPTVVMADDTDKYKTILKPSQGIFRDKGSKFLAFAHPITNDSQGKELVAHYKREYFDARHHCYAYMLGQSRHIYRANDDGEPSGTAGKPILGQINSHELTNIIIIVVRYFGGTLLGTSGLINAYKLASADAIVNAQIVERYQHCHYNLSFDYLLMNDVMKLVKDNNLNLLSQQFDMLCNIEVSFRLSKSKEILERMEKINDLTIKYLKTE